MADPETYLCGSIALLGKVRTSAQAGSCPCWCSLSLYNRPTLVVGRCQTKFGQLLIAAIAPPTTHQDMHQDERGNRTVRGVTILSSAVSSSYQALVYRGRDKARERAAHIEPRGGECRSLQVACSGRISTRPTGGSRPAQQSLSALHPTPVASPYKSIAPLFTAHAAVEITGITTGNCAPEQKMRPVEMGRLEMHQRWTTESVEYPAPTRVQCPPHAWRHTVRILNAATHTGGMAGLPIGRRIAGSTQLQRRERRGKATY